jgi:hypothetical protein
MGTRKVGVIKPLHQKLVSIIQRDGADPNQDFGRARLRYRFVR